MSARVLLTDIETTPITVHTWSLRDLNVGLNQIIEHPRILGVGWKWYGQSATRYASEMQLGRAGMLAEVHEQLDKADVVVHYNGDRFDIPWVQGEFAREGLTPPSPFKSVDLYKVAKKNFRFPSHKLQYVSTALGLEGKYETGGHDLWRRVMDGDEVADRKMGRYCRQDVRLLEPLLDKMTPWLPNTVNMALLNGVEGLACQKCGRPEFLRPKGTAYTATRAYPQYVCEPKRGGCGGWTRDTRSIGGTKTAGVVR